MKASRSVAGASVVLLMGSLITFLGSLLMFADAVESYHLAGQPLSGIVNARLLVFFVLPASFSLLGIVTAIGLFALREWARKSAIFLSTIPVISCASLLLVRPGAVFPLDAQYAILTVGSLGIVMCAYLLVILIPVSAWWLILFTRAKVRAQFRS